MPLAKTKNLASGIGLLDKLSNDSSEEEEGLHPSESTDAHSIIQEINNVLEKPTADERAELETYGQVEDYNYDG